MWFCVIDNSPRSCNVTIQSSCVIDLALKLMLAVGSPHPLTKMANFISDYWHSKKLYDFTACCVL